LDRPRVGMEGEDDRLVPSEEFWQMLVHYGDGGQFQASVCRHSRCARSSEWIRTTDLLLRRQTLYPRIGSSLYSSTARNLSRAPVNRTRHAYVSWQNAAERGASANIMPACGAAA
jgi:hypothetical protein